MVPQNESLEESLTMLLNFFSLLRDRSSLGFTKVLSRWRSTATTTWKPRIKDTDLVAKAAIQKLKSQVARACWKRLHHIVPTTD